MLKSTTNMVSKAAKHTLSYRKHYFNRTREDVKTIFMYPLVSNCYDETYH